ncbi:MAG TPA: tRNA (adenosine(37)-N6)-dimethylallyltransferase MiaA [Alphaproteobacteria bacterium]|nr:tRNA (adenosine(37)-N6)-dimethylallyltransferase MiaA [Alphaproteobacteria bacterium]
MKRSRIGKESPVVVIGGPTASGKSALALGLAERLNGIVINADAMQVYHELRVLTARPTPDEEVRVPHRLYGVLSAAQRCTVARWRRLALAAIAGARREGRLPIVVGGTGLYLKALMEGLARVPDIPAEVRAQAKARHAAVGSQGLHAELSRLDPEMAARLKPGDSQRLIRAWEVITATGQSLAAFQQAILAPPKLWFVPIRLLPPREALYAACDARCRRMLAEGALDEVRALRALGLDPDLPAMKALGLRELMACLDGEVSRTAALAAFQQATRNYAKRQLTWFRHQMPQAQTWNAQFSERLFGETFSFIRKLVDPGQSSH